MEPIAIVGMACRLPGAPSLEEFWNLLRDGNHGIDLIPDSRWNRESTFDPDPEKPGKINTRHGGFLDGIDLFDNDFFRISAEEARQMDPQQRITLELAYEALADAGFSLAEIEGTDAGVFVGVMSNDYLRRQTAGEYRFMDRYTGTGSGYCMIANRISYQFNLRGPSMAIDSACSSSLISTLTACQSLWTRQCSLALAGGVNLILTPTLSVFYTRGGLSAVDGKCRTLSSDASGMGRGEGAGIIVLKRLSDAIRDGDNIYALIRGGAVNHNGRGNGMSAPNRWAQQSLLRKAYEHAGVKSSDLDYVEFHGTGTLIGDAIEATALGSVLAEDQSREAPCRVGSVKTNLGHLEGAAGIAGLIKLALCLSRRQLAPSLWYNGPNPHIAFDTLPLKVQDRLEDWPDQGQLRVAGISSFGLGGANAHLVLQSAPDLHPTVETGVDMKHSVLQLSARSETALIQMASRYRSRIEDLNDEQFSSLSYTTLVRPQGHDHRATFVACNRMEMARRLSGFTSVTPAPDIFTGQYREQPRRKRVFIFFESGGSGFHAAAGLARIHPCFRETLAECNQALNEILSHPIELHIEELSPDVRALPFVHFWVQVALARLWREAGLEPDASAGIGIGQAAAWVVAGAVDIKGAIARIADAHRFELKPCGWNCLAQSSPFLIDCYSSLGKNTMPSLKLAAGETCSTGLPDMPKWKAVDYFVLGLDSIEGTLFGGRDHTGCVIAPRDAESFWRSLAQLSVLHNIRWKNLLVHRTLTSPPCYPWQHSSFWLESVPSSEIPTPQQDPAVRTHASNNGSPAPSSRLNASTVSSDTPIPFTLSRERLLKLPEAERRAVLASYLKEKLAETMRLSAADMDETHTLTGLGLDSLAALHLKNRVEADLRMPLSLVSLLDGRSIDDLAADLLADGLESDNHALSESLPLGDDARSTDDPARHHDDNVAADISELPPEQLDQMLRELLSGETAQQPTPIILD